MLVTSSAPLTSNLKPVFFNYETPLALLIQGLLGKDQQFSLN
jgi:hypothetical protein